MSSGTEVGGAPAGSVTTIRVVLPTHLRMLAGVDKEVVVNVEGKATTERLLDALEARYPQLRGTIRSHDTKRRRDFIRYFACGEDVSHEDPDEPLPDAVVAGEEVFRVVGAIAGG